MAAGVSAWAAQHYVSSFREDAQCIGNVHSLFVEQTAFSFLEAPN